MLLITVLEGMRGGSWWFVTLGDLFGCSLNLEDVDLKPKFSLIIL